MKGGGWGEGRLGRGGGGEWVVGLRLWPWSRRVVRIEMNEEGLGGMDGRKYWSSCSTYGEEVMIEVDWLITCHKFI